MSDAVFKGVYSSSSGLQPDGSTATRKRLWFVWEDPRGGYHVQMLDAARQPKGQKRHVNAKELEAFFTFEPGELTMPLRATGDGARDAAPVSAAADDADASAPGASHAGIRTSGAAALPMQEMERAMRADFALALARLVRGDREAAIAALQELANQSEGLVPAHKYMFTDFGINLRKSKLPEIALKHHMRALDLSPNDSHAHFNVARAFYELGDMDRAERHLETSLSLSPELEASRRFLDFLHRRKRNGAAKASGARR